MITKVTKDNHNKYDLLFAAANKVLGFDNLSDSAIGSIDEYFQAFNTITETSHNATKFIALPLDEPIFEINADTREIKVPSAFSNYGLSVKGDQRAEIVYFSIDRYFDTTDLYKPAENAGLDRSDVINIIIQWEVTQSGATKVRGVSKALFQDVEVLKDQGKMLFGWAINNQITSYTGSVKFSVRFYSINSENQVSFSLSTLTATAPIKDGLDFEIQNGSFTTAVYDDSLAITSRFMNSLVTEEEKLPAAPIFLYNLGDNDGVFRVGNTDYVDLDANGKYLFRVQAYSEDGGTAKMIYTWTIDGNALTEEERSHTSNVTYVESTDDSWNPNKIYYYKVMTESNIESYNIINTAMDYADAVEEYGTIYERFGSFEAARVGEYIAKAMNRQKKGGAEGEEGLYSNVVNSDKIVIPGPGELTVMTTTESIGENDIYQVCTTLDGNDDPIAVITVAGDTTHTANGWTKDKVTYSWVTTDSDYSTAHAADFAPVTADAGVSNVLELHLDEATLAKYDALYTVTINASRNNVATESQAMTFRVTAPAAPLEVERMAAQVRRSGGVATIGVRLTNFDSILHDEIEYAWYHYTSDDVEGNDVFIGNGTVDADGQSCTIEVTEIGSYYCIVTNKVNGSTAVNDLDTDDPEQLITVS